MYALERQQRGPALGAQRLVQRPGKGAEGRKLPVAKAHHRDWHGAGADLGDVLLGVCCVGRGLAFAIGCCKHKHLPRGGRGSKVLQRAGVNAVAALAQRVLQRLGKTPGAAAFAGHEDEHVGLCQRGVAGDVWRLVARLPPDDNARQPEQQHTGAHEPEHHGPGPGRFARVQHHGPVVDALRQGGVLPGQHLARVPVDPTLTLGGGHIPGVFRVGGAGKIQLAQILHRKALQRGQLRAGQVGLAGEHREHLRLGPGVQFHQSQGRGAHGQRRERCQAKHCEHHTARDHVDALRQRATHPRRQLPPAAHAPQQKHQGRDAQHAHDQRNARCTPAPGVAQQQRAVQVLHPARQRRGLPGAQHPAIGRIHVLRLRLVAGKAEHHDGTRGQVANLFRARDGACHALHQRGHGQVARCGGRLPRLLHRVDRQNRAGDAQHHSQGANGQAQPAVDDFPAHASPFTEVGKSPTGCTACRPAACRRSLWTAGCGPPTGCPACLPRRRRCGFHSPRRSVHPPDRR
ncbi:hypothetical protein FQZ97_703420 [compost metagenome]